MFPKCFHLPVILGHFEGGVTHPHFPLHPPQLHRRKFPLFRDQGSQQNRLARSPVSLEVGSNRGMCVTDVQLSHADPIIVEEAVEKE